MIWFHRLRQRLSLTRNEALTLIVLSSFFSAGLILRHFQLTSQPVPPDAYEEMDRMFFEASPEKRADSTEEARHATDSPGEPGKVPQYSIDSPNGGGESADHAIGSADARIDINRSPAAELERLPRVGPKTAERIIAFRETYGPFRHVDDLIQVRGIGPKTLEQIRPYATVTADSLTTDPRSHAASSR